MKKPRFVDAPADCGCPECGSPVAGELDTLTGAASYRCTETDGPCDFEEVEDGFDADPSDTATDYREER